MNKFAFVFMLFLAVAVGAQSLEPIRQDRQPLTRAEPERAAKAQELLAQTRAALSQSAKLGDIKTLSVGGKVRRAAMSASVSAGGTASVAMIGGDVDPTIFGAQTRSEHFVNGKVEYNFSLPDKFHWQDETAQFQRVGFLDGEQFWQKNNHHPLVVPPHFAAMIQQRIQSEYAPLTLGLLLAPPPAFALEFTYVDEKPFQQTIAEVIAVVGPGTFKADLYLDQKTHLPLLLRFVIGGISRPAMVFTPGGTPRAEAMRALDIAKQEAQAKPPGLQEREKLILFEDYRAEDGILFPHKITTQINGRLIEEILFAKFKVNQPIKPEKFTKKQ